ncbi:MAG: NAD(P)-binding domain-containing protein [Oscillospiraceae bacterium]|nr:NAD(P)-binding domain-containing protein [Oscillospiraceae bacterium]
MNIAIIGFGNLGRALASGLVKSGCVAAGGLFVCEVDENSQALAKGNPYNAFVSDDINVVVADADTIFLTVKGYVFESLSQTLDKSKLAGKTVVSFMAGVQFDQLVPYLGDAFLVRAMPSLAISVCDGVIGYTKAPEEVEKIFHKLGFAFETEPENIEKVMAFSSCGLGFAAYLIDAFSSAGSAVGFSADISARIAALTFKNAIERGDFRATVGAVATPGGATEQGVKHMDENNVYDIVSQAVRKAYERMVKL